MSQSIYCDESGFTGTNLSDREQPFFVYASVAISETAAAEIVAKVVRDFKLQSRELKGRVLVRSERGKRALSSLFEQCLGRSQIVLVNKLYALACKLFEYVFEPPLADKSSIFYDLSFHKFVSTLLFAEAGIPTAPARKLLNRFEVLMRAPSAGGLATLFDHPVAKRRTRSVAKEVLAFAHGQRTAIIDELKTIESLGKLGRWTLDVTDAALYSLLCHWGTKFDELEVFCDESKPLSTYLTAEPSLFAAMVGRKDKQYIELGGKRKPVTFCLARSVSLVNSASSYGIQIADAIASGLSYALKTRGDAAAKEWLAAVDKHSALNGDSIVPEQDLIDHTKPGFELKVLLFSELVARSRKGINVLEGIETFMRFPFAPRLSRPR
jgi:hypothetical protein